MLWRVALWASLVLFGIGVGAVGMRLIDRSQQQEGYPAYTESAAQDQGGGAAAAQPGIKAPKYKTPCQQPNGREESNLCAQWRSTKAAEKSADSASDQTVTNLIGVLFVVLSICVSAIAALHASRAAEATKDANRPWVEIKITKPLELATKDNVCRLKFKALIRNVGRSPATHVLYRAILVPCRIDLGKVHGVAATLAELERLMDKFEKESPNTGNTIFPGDEGEEIDFGPWAPISALGPGTAPKAQVLDFYVGMFVRYKFGERWCRTAIVRMVTTDPRRHFPANQISLLGNKFKLSGMSSDYAT